jgi:taurine dioxygenase
MRMNTTTLEPLGARVTDLAVGRLDAADVGRLRALLADRGVVVLPGQHVDDAAFVGFLASFGELMFTEGETPVPGFGTDLNVVTNVGRATPPRSVFHVDTSYVPHPPAYTALRAVRIPERGGQTLFTDQYRAYDTLPAGLRAMLDGRTVTHRVGGLEAEHPVLRSHPVSGRTSLYLSTPQRCVAISGMAPDEATVTIDLLYEHSTGDAPTYRHTWSPGDVVMWDNGCVMHRADHDGVVGDRVMHRGMVRG